MRLWWKKKKTLLGRKRDVVHPTGIEWILVKKKNGIVRVCGRKVLEKKRESCFFDRVDDR